MAEYIIQKAVELSKVIKKRRDQLQGDALVLAYSAWRKYDGCMAIIGPIGTNDIALSRTGESYVSLGPKVRAMREEFGGEFVFIGEAWKHGMSFAEASGVFRRGVESLDLDFIVHDILTIDEWRNGLSTVPFRERIYRVSEEALNAAGVYLARRHTGLTTLAQAQELCNQLVAAGGYDGLVFRDPEGGWKPGSGTTGEIIKLKSKLSFDLRVLEVKEATGEKTGRAVYSLVVDFKGRALGVGSGVPHKLADVPPVGSIVEVEAMNFSDDGLLREPRYKGQRFDKLEAD